MYSNTKPYKSVFVGISFKFYRINRQLIIFGWPYPAGQKEPPKRSSGVLLCWKSNWLLCLFLEKRSGEVAVARVGEERYDRLALVLWALCELDRCPQSRTGRDAYEYAFTMT